MHIGCSCCKSLTLTNLSAEDEMATALAKMVDQIWKDKGIKEGTFNSEVTALFEKQLWDGVVKGFGMDLSQADYDTPDYQMLQALKDNVQHFSEAKNYHQLRELSDALIGDDGKLRSRSQFMEAAAKINEAYTSRYLAVEYELAVAGGQMSAKWVQIQANKDTLPLLEFDAVLDGQTTELCKSLNGVILPIGHPFWNTYYPPNHFNCRSTVRQRGTGKVTPADNIPSADIPNMFKTNLGKQGLIFPPDHPYFIDLPEELKKQ
jgi:SPP1 gp7 family putative phage head morphogenesis protein